MLGKIIYAYISVISKKSWLKISSYFGCVLYIGTWGFSILHPTLGCVLYTGACYTQAFMVFWLLTTCMQKCYDENFLSHHNKTLMDRHSQTDWQCDSYRVPTQSWKALKTTPKPKILLAHVQFPWERNQLTWKNHSWWHPCQRGNRS